MNNDKLDVALDESSEQLVVFNLANECYGVDIAAVNTIIRMQNITAVPQTPDFVEGVINLRGRIIPVIDLRKRFGLAVGEITKASRIVVVEASGQLIGMVVDAVAETLRLPQSAIEPPSLVIESADSEYLRGVGKLEDRLLILLDLDKVLSTNEVRSLGGMEKVSAQDAQEAARAA